MKQTLLFTALGFAALGAGAQEIGRVISATPVVQQVAVPRTYCSQPQMVAPPQTSGAGGLMGAIAGGAIGSTIGHGSGTAAAVVLGTIGGAILGNNIEAGGARPAYAQPVCGTETTYENRTIGYDVAYEYAGRQYSTRMPYDPGPTIQLQVTPTGSAPSMPPQATGPVIAPPIQAATVQSATVYVPPTPVYVQPYAAYPAYPPVYAAPYPYYRPYYPPVGVSLNFGFHGHRHRHRY